MLLLRKIFTDILTHQNVLNQTDVSIFFKYGKIKRCIVVRFIDWQSLIKTTILSSWMKIPVSRFWMKNSPLGPKNNAASGAVNFLINK